MAKLSSEDTKHVAKLAQLNLSEEEIKKFTIQLSNVLDYITQLNKIDTKDIQPTSQTTDLKNVYKEDKIDATRILTQEEALSGKDDTINGFFVVPRIIKK